MGYARKGKTAWGNCAPVPNRKSSADVDWGEILLQLMRGMMTGCDRNRQQLHEIRHAEHCGTAHFPDRTRRSHRDRGHAVGNLLGNYILNFSPTINHFFSAPTYGNRNAGGKLIAFLESVDGEVWEVMLAGIGIRYLKMTHAGRLEVNQKQ